MEWAAALPTQAGPGDLDASLSRKIWMNFYHVYAVLMLSEVDIRTGNRGTSCLGLIVCCCLCVLCYFLWVLVHRGKSWRMCFQHPGYKIPGDKNADGTVMRCYDKEHITTWYDDNHCFTMFLQQCNARLVRWVGASFRGMAVPVLLELELDDRHDRARRDIPRPEHFKPTRPVDQHRKKVDATEHMKVNVLGGCSGSALSRQVSLNTPQNVIEASYRSRAVSGPRWPAAEWAAYRESRG
jgi:hypothetical protein